MENKKLIKIEIEEDNFIYLTEDGICGTLMKDPFYKMELNRTPLTKRVESIDHFWDILSEEQYDIHLKDFPKSIKNVSKEMENDLISEIFKIDNSNGYDIVSITLENKSDFSWVINSLLDLK